MWKRLKQEEQKLSNWHADLRTRHTREEKNNHSEWSAGLKTRSERNIPQKNSFDTWGAVKDSAQDALRKTAQIPRNVAAGVGDILDLPIMAANYGLRSAGVNSQIPHVGQGIAEGIDTLTGGYTKPQASDERLTEAVTRAVSGIPAGALAGAKLASTGIKGISKLGRGLQKINPIEGTNIAGTGAGALAAHSYNESNPEDFFGTLGSGLAADMATRTAMGLVNKRNWANALKINPEAAEFFKEMELNPTLAQVSDSNTVKHFENIFKNTNFDNKITNRYADQYEKMSDIIGPASQNRSKTALQTGMAAKKSMKEYSKEVDSHTKELRKHWEDKLDKHGDPNIDVTNSLSTYEKIAGDLDIKIERNPKTGKFKQYGKDPISELFANSPMGKAYETLRGSAENNNSRVSIKKLEVFRKHLYDQIYSLPPKDNTRRQLTLLVSQINRDIGDYMKRIGAENDWNEYNRYYSNHAELRKPHLADAEGTPKHLAHVIANKFFDEVEGRSLIDTVYVSQKKPQQESVIHHQK